MNLKDGVAPKFVCWYFHSFESFDSFSYIYCIHCVLLCVYVITLDTAVMAKKHNTPFQCHHAFEFGLRICECSVGTSPAVVTAVCRLYEVFGKEEEAVGSKRGRPYHVK